MSLSNEEHHAWNELERSLADEFPGGMTAARSGSSRVLSAPPWSWLVTVPELTLAAGVIILFLALAVNFLLLGLAGLVMMCAGVDRMDRRRGHLRSTGAHGPSDG